LFAITPRGGQPTIPVPYFLENWTGSEYAAAALMIQYGMVKQGIECVANVRVRYDGEKADPYGESEYGRRYARAMASWALIPSLSGFSYNAITDSLDVTNRMAQSDLASFWSTVKGWGRFVMTKRRFHLQPSRGYVIVRNLGLSITEYPHSKISLRLGGQEIRRGVEVDVNQLKLSAPIRIDDSHPLEGGLR